jgi:hypothetical protein
MGGFIAQSRQFTGNGNNSHKTSLYYILHTRDNSNPVARKDYDFGTGAPASPKNPSGFPGAPYLHHKADKSSCQKYILNRIL